MNMTEFQRLQMVDVIEPIRDMIGRGIDIRPDDTLFVNQHVVPGPWIVNEVDKERNCELWTIWHNKYRFIPAGCRQCWKITYSPHSLKEVYQVLELQDPEKGLGLPAKVGMENRIWTGNVGGYSAFWYAPLGCGLHRARGIHTRIKSELTKTIKYSPDLVLKRGCTEFERLMGPSDTWDQSAMEQGWDEREKILASVFRIDPPRQPSKLLEINTKLRMIYYAHEHSDQTYKDFVGQDSLPPLTRYEKSIHSDKDFPPEDKHGITDLRHEDASDDKEASPKLTLV